MRERTIPAAADWLVDFLNTPTKESIRYDILAWLRVPDFESNSKKIRRKKLSKQKLRRLYALQLEKRLCDVADALNDAVSRGILIPRWDPQVFNPKKTRLEPGQGVYKIGNKQITFRSWRMGEGVEGLALGALAYLLVSGKLDRIRQCRECDAFYYASHRTKEYCKPEHQRAHDKRAAPARAKQWRIDHPPAD